MLKSFAVTQVGPPYLHSICSLCIFFLLNHVSVHPLMEGNLLMNKCLLLLSSNKPASVSLVIIMYWKAYICSAFVSFTSRSDSSSFLDKVGLVCGTESLGSGERSCFPPSHWQLGIMAHWTDICTFLTMSHVCTWHLRCFLYSNLLWAENETRHFAVPLQSCVKWWTKPGLSLGRAKTLVSVGDERIVKNLGPPV